MMPLQPLVCATVSVAVFLAVSAVSAHTRIICHQLAMSDDGLPTAVKSTET
jgi:hypothetical protein